MSRSLIRRIILLSLSSALINTQSIPGASFFSGNGIPNAGQYQLIDDYEPSVFFNKFNFYSSYDPTYGHVQYVNQAVATQNGYVSTTSQGTARIGVDTTNNWPRGGPGRPSVRIISDNTYTHGLFIFDAAHMPTGCGTWPAYWLLGPSWPSNGEIDIIEGVNTLTQDSISLHSSPGCTVAGSGQTGTLQTTNCDSNANGNSGCGSTLNSTTIPNNYGVPFNNNGGGVYATEWTSSYFKTWFFPRGSIPSSITNGRPDVSTFGTPAVNHQGSCNIDQHFNNMSIIINIDFCGAWAGQVYSQYTDCPQNTSTNSLNSCVDFVGNNPSYFTRAYWEINSLKVYQMPPGAVPSSSYTTSLSSASPTASTNTINLGNGQSTSVSSAQYTGPLTSVTTSAAQASSTPIICPTYNNTAYTNFNKQSYTIGCGLDYNGAGTNLPGNGVYSAKSFENCLEICDSTSGCVAVAYVGGNFAGTCYAKSTQGTFVYSGAVNAAIRAASNVSSVASISASATAPVNAGPTCPGSAGSTYTDSNNVAYSIVCNTDFSSNNIGSPSSYTSLSACLPACDAMTGCAGAIFNSALNLCQLKSSFSGSQNNNQSVIAARRNAVVTSSSSLSSSKSSSSVAQNGYGGDPGYGGYGYSRPPTSDDYGYGYEPATSYVVSSSSSSAALTSSSSIRSSVAISSTSSIFSTSSSSSSTARSSTASSTSSSVAGSTSVLYASSSSLLSSSSPSIGSSSLAAPSTSSTSTQILSSSTASSYLLSSSSSISSSSSLSSSSSSSYYSSPSPSRSSSSSISQYFPSIPKPSSASSLSSSVSSGQSSTTPISASSGGSSSSLIFSLSFSSTGQSTTSVAGYSISLTASLISSTTLASSSTISKITSAAPCPSSASAYCSQPSGQQTICSDNTGAIYAVTCGTVYDGNIIDTSGVYGRAVELIIRATEPNVAACQNLCDRVSGCVAFNYIGTNCVLLSSISQTYNQPNAIGASLVASAVSVSSAIPMSSITQYFSSPTSSPVLKSSSGSSTAASTSSSTISATTPAASTNVIITATQSGNTVTLTTTTTTQAPPGGYYTTNSNGSYYVYSSTPSNSASLCYTCVLTPTIITTGNPGSNTQLPTCSPRTGTTTVFTTSTLTTCPPQPTCPASGYVLISASQSRPDQQIVTTTDSNGKTVTYTQVPASSVSGGGTGGNGSGNNGSGGNGSGGNGSGGNGSGGSGGSPTSGTSPGNTNTPTCPQSDGTRFTDSMGMVYEIQCGIIYTDATLDTQTQNTITGCIASCDMYNTKSFYTAAQCLGISWFPELSTNNCLLKAGSTPRAQKNCDSCQLLTPGNHINNNNTNSYSNGAGSYGSMSGGLTFTTVVGGSTQVSTYTTTAPASIVTQYSTIVSNGQTTANIVGYSTVPGSTIIGTTTNVVGGSTIVTQGGGPGYYGGGGNGGNRGTTIVTGGGSGPGNYGGGGGSFPSTVYAVSTAVSTYVSNGQTILSTYGVTTAQSVVYLPATTKTVTTTSVSVSISLQVTSILTTIITTVSQGYTTTIVTYIPETITPSGYYGGGGYGGNGGNGGTVTVTQSAGPGTTVYVTETVTMTVLPSSTSSSFTCRTYATNYLNGLHGRAEPTSSPKQGNGMILMPVLSPPTRQRKGSIFEKDVVLAQIAKMPKVAPNILAHEFELWFVE